MAYKNKEKQKIHQAEYYLTNRDKLKARASEYRANNKERIKAHKAEYYAKNKERIKAYRVEYYARNKQKEKADRAEYYIQNKDIIKVRQAEHYIQHKDKIIDHQLKYRRNHPEKHALGQARRRARIANTEITLTEEQWQIIKDMFKQKCVYCGKRTRRLTKDHIIPLSQGGGLTLQNIVPACQSCNSKKQTSSPLKPLQVMLL